MSQVDFCEQPHRPEHSHKPHVGVVEGTHRSSILSGGIVLCHKRLTNKMGIKLENRKMILMSVVIYSC